jgi:hypothetical protein
MGVKNDSTLVFNKYRVTFDPPLDGVGLNVDRFYCKKYNTKMLKTTNRGFLNALNAIIRFETESIFETVSHVEGKVPPEAVTV